jgi:para-nitrobenzyl esterase
MKPHRYALFSILFIVFVVGWPLAEAWAATTVGEIVNLDAGQIRGTTEGARLVYRGIPYAAPPVGNLRFAPPQPVTPWSSTKLTVSFPYLNSPGCPQIAGGQEDCLYLNVYAPVGAQRGAHLPVMVFLHGGGHLNGTPQKAYIDGTTLPMRRVIVVTADYRLGTLGWIAFPEAPTAGSNGMLDEIAVLQWIHNNIPQFGGHPGKVMLFGQSAGARDVTMLLSVPGVAGNLFTRAAVESEAPVVDSLGQCTGGQCTGALARGALIEQQLGCAGTPDVLACMRGEIPNLNGAIVTLSALEKAAAPFALNSIVDGVLLTQPPQDAIATQGTVPLIVGSNTDEYQFFNPTVDYAHLGQTLSDSDYRAGISNAIHDPAAAAIWAATYPSSGGNAALAFVDWASDYFMQCPARSLARAAVGASQANAVFKYVYAHTLSNNPLLAKRGAFHTQELYMVFGAQAGATVSVQAFTAKSVNGADPSDPLLDPTVNANFLYTFTTDDARLSDAVQGYWTRFAATGDPNGAGATCWPSYVPSDSGEKYLRLDYANGMSGIDVLDHWRMSECDYWDSTYVFLNP